MLRDMGNVLRWLMLIVLLSACAESRAASEADDESPLEDGGAEQGFVPDSIPDTTVPDCLPGSPDPGFVNLYGEAKDTCSREVGYVCGTISIELSTDGCATSVTGEVANLQGDAADTFLDCMAEQLIGTCSHCEASRSRRFYESCTLL